MLAIRYYGNKDIRLDDIPEPKPGPGEVKVRVTHIGICATDIDAALLRLTSGGRDAMGELFKVLAVADPKLETVPGFDS